MKKLFILACAIILAPVYADETYTKNIDGTFTRAAIITPIELDKIIESYQGQIVTANNQIALLQEDIVQFTAEINKRIDEFNAIKIEAQSNIDKLNAAKAAIP